MRKRGAPLRPGPQAHGCGREQVRLLPPVRIPLSDARAQDRQDRPHLQSRTPTGPAAPSRRSTARRSPAGCCSPPWATPRDYPVYWDRLLLNASQVTNPPIDPLREPMETRTFLGRKTDRVERDEKGSLQTASAPQLKLSVPILFSAMSYGSISYNAHESLARARRRWAPYYNTGEGGLHEDFYKYGANTIVQVASGRLRRAQGLPAGGRGHRDQDGPGRKAGHRRPPAGREDRGRRLPHAHDPGGLRRHLPPRRTTTSTPSRTCTSSSTP